MRKMKAAVVSQPDSLVLQEIPPPECGPYEALTETLVCGICNTTDSEIIRGEQPFCSTYPCVLGHEAIGRVVQVGEKVQSFKVGDLVTRPCAIWPGEQTDGIYSGWGGFAEYGIVRDRAALERDGVFRPQWEYQTLRQRVVPPDLPPEHAALCISLAETRSWILSLGTVEGKSVVVMGTGVAGLSLTLYARLLGARIIVTLGRRQERLDRARELGADYAFDTRQEDALQEIRRVLNNGADFALSAVGGDGGIPLLLRLLAPGGTLALYGIPTGNVALLPLGIGPGDYVFRLAPANEHLAYEWCWEALRRKWIDPHLFLTHEWPLDDILKAFEDVAQHRVIKGVVRIKG